MKKKYVLKSWVKDAMFYMACGILMAGCIWLISLTEQGNDKAVDSCMAYGGSTYETCVRGVYGY